MRDPRKDPYAMLGVPPSATAAEIRRAYRKRIVVTHRSGVLGLVGDLEELREAYETLRNPDRRRDYDAVAKPSSPAQSVSAEADTRERRGGRLLERVRRDMARQSLHVGAAARAENAEMVRSLGDEHDRRVLEEASTRARQARIRRALGVLCWLLVAVVGVWLLTSRR